MAWYWTLVDQWSTIPHFLRSIVCLAPALLAMALPIMLDRFALHRAHAMIARPLTVRQDEPSGRLLAPSLVRPIGIIAALLAFLCVHLAVNALEIGHLIRNAPPYSIVVRQISLAAFLAIVIVWFGVIEFQS
jgi:hypothetical protein